ncbi:MAG: hypothetical protein KF709_13005 [Gemmatimonadaceae bacterium]|nr:hypothetical protein [Gemmatimonadaceae bacterium]
MPRLPIVFCAALLATLPRLSAAQAAEITRPDQKPTYTTAELQADFDQAIDFINAFAVHRDLNAVRLGIDYERRFAALRQAIGTGTDLCAFSALLGRAINLVQDLHASTMSYDYLREYGRYQSRLNIAEDESYEGVAALVRHCPAPEQRLDLPLVFVDGAYVVYADIEYRGERLSRGTVLTTINGETIPDFIQGHLDVVRPLRMSNAGIPYSLRFYRAAGQGFHLGLADGRVLEMQMADSVRWLSPRAHAIGFASQSTHRVEYFETQRLLYIGLPMMNVELADSINGRVDALVRSGAQFDRIAIDIRGNPGGSDLTWRGVLGHLLGRELAMRLDLRMKDNPSARARYGRADARPATAVPQLRNARYWPYLDNEIRFGPDSISLDFRGPIYVLRDAYIYSSAANFAVFANGDPQLTTVGAATDLVGGSQIEPLFIKLDHTGLVFRVEPALDFLAVGRLEDFAHNEVEVEIRPTAEDYHRRATYEGDIYGREFLLTLDPLMRYVLSQAATGSTGASRDP